MAELATAQALHEISAQEPVAPTVDEVWELLGRADVIMRSLFEAPDRAALQRCRGRVDAWLRDVNQVWVRTPTRRPRAAGGNGRS